MSSYTSREKVSRHLKRKQQIRSSKDNESTSSKRRRRSDNPNFSFLEHCLVCGQVCNVKRDDRNPGRWRKAYVCRTGEDADLKGSILNICA